MLFSIPSSARLAVVQGLYPPAPVQPQLPFACLCCKQTEHRMKNLLLLTLLSLSLYSAQGQNTVSATDWQADLRYLQKIIHDEYPFLFRKITAEDFDAQVETFYEAIPEMEPYEIAVGFTRIVSLFGYGHTSFPLSRSGVPYHRIPLNLYWFSDGVFIEGAHRDYADAVGARILAVEGVPVEQVLERVKAIFPAENDLFFKAYGMGHMLTPEVLHAQGLIPELTTELEFTLEKDGETMHKTLVASDSLSVPTTYGITTPGDEWMSMQEAGERPLYQQQLERIYFWEYLPEQKAVYVRHSQIQDEEDQPIPAFYAEIFEFVEQNEVERLILDVRLNGGGNNYKNKPIITGLIRTEKINQPGKLFVIIGRRTFSACQNLVNELDNYTNAIFVGEPTGENINFYGDNNRLELPRSKAPVYLSFAWWQDKPQWENADWLAPDIAVEMSSEDYRRQRDPVLETALTLEGGDIILDPMLYLQDLFIAGEIEKVQREAQRMVSDPQLRFYPFEQRFLRAANNLARSEQPQGALMVLQMTTDLFPTSAASWHELGKLYRQLAQPQAAREAWKKAVALDPEGPTGKEAADKLEKMK